MAKLTKMPSLAIISGFKGTIDYYVYMGIPCARSWPRSPGHKRSPAVEAQWPAFTWPAHNWLYVSLAVREAYQQTSAETNLCARDLFTKAFITSYFREGL